MILDKNIEVEEGYDIKIKCLVRGNPKPAIKWKRSGKPLPTNIDYEDGQKTLVIRKAKLENSGNYICIARNNLVQASSQSKLAVVKQLSFFFKSLPSIQIYEQQKFTVSCIYEYGVEPIVIKWYKFDKLLTGDRYLITRNNQILTIKNVMKSDAGNYKCIVQSKFSKLQSVTTLSVKAPKTCKDLRLYGEKESRVYTVYPTISRPVKVYCDMSSKNGVGVTVISHDSEGRTRVAGIEAKGGYKRLINYEISNDYIKAIVKSSNKCEQYTKYECKGSVIAGGYAWWVSAGGRRMTNWGGVDHTRKGCACSLTNSCAGGNVCNCDKNDSVWREDYGLLQEKEFLPISEVRFGDTGDKGEEGYYTIGKLKCY